MKGVLLVFFGGGVGSVARYLVGLATLRAFGPAFPIGTLAVNVTGSFAMAIAFHFAGKTLPDAWRLALATGFLGGFTTYSSFNQESVAMFQEESWGRGALYVALTLLSCWAAAALGLLAARALSR